MNSLHTLTPAKVRRCCVVTLVGATMAMVAVQPVSAQSGRPNSTTMTCAQVQSMISQRGAVVLSTGQYTFDRYVANRNACQHGEFLRRDYVPTRDAKKCQVQRCANRSRIFDD